MNIPNSTGTNPPSMQVPRHACDSHMHIYDAKFPRAADAATLPGLASVAEYKLLQKRLGTSRTVVVTPRNYETDNRVTLDAIKQLGIKDTRGVAVLRDDVTDRTLQELHDGGIRGIRFSLYTPAHAAVSFEMVEPLSRRVHELGWHVQLHWTADQYAQHEAMLMRLPSTIVIDHMGRMPQPIGVSHPAHAIIRKLLDQGRTWLKLSGPYLDSRQGAQGEYRDIDAVAQSWIQARADRLVWGSDWPHPTEKNKPDDALLIDLLDRWTQDTNVIRKILVDNPASLYGFEAA